MIPTPRREPNWERYDHDAIPLPAVARIPPEARDPHSCRLYDNYDRGEYRITEDHIRGARHAYYTNGHYD